MNLEGCIYKFNHIYTCKNIRENEIINLRERESWGRDGWSLTENMGDDAIIF